MHLYIAIAQISENVYLFVNATTPRENSEMSCVLNPGLGVPDFIVRESVIVYKHAREINITKLAEENPLRKGSCSEDILLAIQKGGLVSRQLKNKYKTILKALFDIT